MNLIKICVCTCDMTSRIYFGKMNSTLGSVVPLAMFFSNIASLPFCVDGGFEKRLLRLLKIEELFHYLYRVLELLCFVLIVYIPLLWSSPRKVCLLF